MKIQLEKLAVNISKLTGGFTQKISVRFTLTLNGNQNK